MTSHNAGGDDIAQRLKLPNRRESLLDLEDHDIVVVPSLSLDEVELAKVTAVLHYEERQLFLLLALKKPLTRIFYLTSAPIDNAIIEYFLNLAIKMRSSARLIPISTNDNTTLPLSKKILNRPRLIARIKSMLRPGKGYMVCYTSTILEAEVAKRLGVPLMANHPDNDHWGSKSGSRTIFAEAKVPHALGVPRVTCHKKLAASIAELCNKNQAMKKLVVKLDQGFSGNGNAVLDVSELAKDGFTEQSILQQLAKMDFMSETESWEGFSKKIDALGAVAEMFMDGELASPSLQGFITPAGKVEVLSTHDQVLERQVYKGCIFPAMEEHKKLILEFGQHAGDVLASKGARGHFGIDFLVFNNSETKKLDVCAIEINLRQCGTTHPYMAMKYLTNGSYDPKAGLFFCEHGHPKFYIASDNLHKESYKGLLPADLLGMMESHGLVYDHTTHVGPVFHLLGALSQYGKVGVTCIANSRDEAATLFDKVEKVLNFECSPTSPSMSAARAASSLPNDSQQHS